MVYEGIAMWASITTPNTRFEPKYSINLVVDNDTAQTLKNEGFSVKFDKEEGKSIEELEFKLAIYFYLRFSLQL